MEPISSCNSVPGRLSYRWCILLLLASVENTLMQTHGHISSGYTPPYRPYSEHIEAEIVGTLVFLLTKGCSSQAWIIWEPGPLFWLYWNRVSSNIMNVPKLITQQRWKMIDVLSILAEPVHKKAKISNMLYRYNIFIAYLDGNIINFFELLMCPKDNELRFLSFNFNIFLAIQFLISSIHLSIWWMQSSWANCAPTGPGLKLR